ELILTFISFEKEVNSNKGVHLPKYPQVRQQAELQDKSTKLSAKIILSSCTFNNFLPKVYICIHKEKKQSKEEPDKVKSQQGVSQPYQVDSARSTSWLTTKQNRHPSIIESVPAKEGRLCQKQDPSTCEIIEHMGVRKIIHTNQARIPCQTRSNDCISHQLARDERSTIVIGEFRIVHMIRKRNSNSFHPFDLEIEETLNKIRKSKNMHVGHNCDSFSFILETDHFEIKPDFANNPLSKLEPMENNNRTLKELAMLNSGLIHLLPKFHDLASENPYKHLKEFHVVCSTMRP
ncbi:hypothetical protein CR513_19903, partial [Mucuna pruriens]